MSVDAFTSPGRHEVTTPVTCVLTRFALRRPWQLVRAYLDYRRVVRDLRSSSTPGLLRSAFLIESLTTFYSFSIWDSPASIPVFGTRVARHVEVARRVFRDLSFEPKRGPELWSTRWQLTAVSNNLNWGDFDLRADIERLADDDSAGLAP